VIARRRLPRFACLLAIALRALPPSGGSAAADDDSIVHLAAVKAAFSFAQLF
jgi:hypothetical protein